MPRIVEIKQISISLPNHDKPETIGANWPISIIGLFTGSLLNFL